MRDCEEMRSSDMKIEHYPGVQAIRKGFCLKREIDCVRAKAIALLRQARETLLKPL